MSRPGLPYRSEHLSVRVPCALMSLKSRGLCADYALRENNLVPTGSRRHNLLAVKEPRPL